jgi:hypothetical protein
MRFDRAMNQPTTMPAERLPERRTSGLSSNTAPLTLS